MDELVAMTGKQYMALAGTALCAAAWNVGAGSAPADILGPISLFVIGIMLWIPLLLDALRSNRSKRRRPQNRNPDDSKT
jgi:hypothetical protein